MHSLAKPDAYYQVVQHHLTSTTIVLLTTHCFKILLSQGIAAGIGAGMLYVPSIAILSHYFRKRRALAMTLVASGSSMGAVVHPLMLNNTLNNPSIGFAIAARANAGLISALLLLACLLMRTRLDPPEHHIDLWKAARRFATDTPYVCASLG